MPIDGHNSFTITCPYFVLVASEGYESKVSESAYARADLMDAKKDSERQF
jgi:hypothetical protein